MYSKLSIISNIIGFLDESCANLPVFKTELETIISVSSALEAVFGETALLLRKMKTKKAALETEKRAWVAEEAHFENLQSFKSTIKLNVGGQKYRISLSTLRQYPDTMLGAMFSGRHTIIPDSDGFYFVDRDGTRFRHILNLLRSPETYYKVAMDCHFLCKKS